MEVDRDKNATWCPGDKCGGVIYRSGALMRKATCEKCGIQICFDCKKPYHGPLTSCTKDVDEAFDSWAKEQFMKRCPACSRFIIKLDGCNHMTCSCGYEFCWVCGAFYYDGHFARFNPFGCPGLQYAETNGLCTNFFLVRWIFKLIQIAILLPLVLLVLAIQIVICPFALMIWIGGKIADDWGTRDFAEDLFCCAFRFDATDLSNCIRRCFPCCD
eukprot:TRINITY_DN4274_c0_g1_i2.p1 TRINITY_DN4274_c0_g1~~TRINITY_DN4274_c0_g1_i2.p1  ORF type:complete len:245 (-),score=45.78 TRINITY_DN4274_c0_g1_i2:87-731(-)